MNKTRIIDRSVLEISSYIKSREFREFDGDRYRRILNGVGDRTHKKKEDIREDITDLIELMKILGADLQEINSITIELLKNLPRDIKYIFNLEKKEDFFYIQKYGFDTVVINKNIVENSSVEYDLDKIKKKNIKIILEIYANNLEKALLQIEELKGKIDLCDFKGIKIFGLSEEYPHEIGVNIKKFKNKLVCMGENIDIWICPDNKSFSATALAVELYDEGVDYINLSFNGFKSESINNWACFEEVVMALNIIYKKEIKSTTNLFPQVKGLFEKLTDFIIEDNKPVIGSGIFKCESGIHVDGINKDSSTYEPFNPEIIGQKREFILGKHSGSKGLEIKLKELGINFKKEELSNLLDRIREKSILNSGVMDNQIIFNLVSECEL
ncbi:homocitrate synthase/isopropylmalate synthase family protein [Clostridium grantii]|uniref:Homocitrate synthase NifV n=1 Tax=Clostridium grantii DSM 8605 TaxID=1121316 RepID=A0A1M5UX38_9CLOT|nr:hypothetical protein [Clostridium grantii]SHH67532.1 homocitrate synthase NifV [Clostridium grantii DSM 8605]